jgi:hypothetical protein
MVSLTTPIIYGIDLIQLLLVVAIVVVLIALAIYLIKGRHQTKEDEEVKRLITPSLARLDDPPITTDQPLSFDLAQFYKIGEGIITELHNTAEVISKLNLNDGKTPKFALKGKTSKELAVYLQTLNQKHDFLVKATTAIMEDLKKLKTEQANQDKLNADLKQNTDTLTERLTMIELYTMSLKPKIVGLAGKELRQRLATKLNISYEEADKLVNKMNGFLNI